jgi:hypothetical protein
MATPEDKELRPRNEERAISDQPKKLGRSKIEVRNLDTKTVRRGLLAFLVVVAALVGVIALGDDDSNDGATTSAQPEKAVALSALELVEKGSTFDHPVYWIGPQVGTHEYELSSDSSENVYVRYLTGNEKAGSSAQLLTVGTYPLPDAKEALQHAEEEAAGTQQISKLEGYEVLGSKDTTNAYIVFDDQPELQVEVFSPKKGEAQRLATAGALQPIGA